MGLRAVLVEANASAIDRHAKHGIQPAAQLHQPAAWLSNAPTLAVHVELQHLLQRPNRVPWTTARAQTGLRTVLVEADASAIDRHAKRGIQPAAQLHQRAALLSNAPKLAMHVELEHLLQRSNRVQWTAARTQTGLRTVLVEADASAINRHTKHNMKTTAHVDLISQCAGARVLETTRASCDI